MSHQLEHGRGQGGRQLALALALFAAWAAGCDDGGGSSGKDSDDGGGDAGTGGAGGAATGTTVEVVYHDGSAAPGVTVVGHDAEGAAIAELETDAAGRAVLDLPPGGGVSLAWREPGAKPRRAIDSVMGIEPGALITRTIGPPPDGPTMDLSFAVSSAPPLAYAHASCWSAPVPLDQTLAVGYPGCPGQATFDALITAYDDGVKVLPYLDLDFDPGNQSQLALSVASTAFVSWPDTLAVTVLAPNGDQHNPVVFLRGAADDGATLVARGLGAGLALDPTLMVPILDERASRYWLEARTTTQSGLELTGVAHRRSFAVLPADIILEPPALAAVRMVTLTPGARPELGYLLDRGERGDAMAIELRWEDLQDPDEVRWWLTVPIGRLGEARFPELPGAAAPTTEPTFALVFHRDVAGAEGVVAAFNAVGSEHGEVSETVAVSIPTQ